MPVVQLSLVAALLHLLLLSHLSTSPAHAHGFLDLPATRGALNHPLSTGIVDPTCPRKLHDYFLVFPAGAKCTVEGCALKVQKRVAGYRWTPFEPLKPGFRWRAGVCGDEIPKFDHLRGGRYFCPPNSRYARIVKTYRPGGVLDARLKIIGHHGGFIEFHLCDITKCPGNDISQECFRRGHCIQLKRIPNPICDSGKSRLCGPIDRKFPGRWYLPCSKYNSDAKWDIYGLGTIKYRIPRNFRCEHCVLHWFWSAGNKCNANGVIDYFDGPDRPWGWGKCPGQAEAVGGVSRVQPNCVPGGKFFPEDYYACADIAVKGAPIGTPKKRPNMPRARPNRSPKLTKIKTGRGRRAKPWSDLTGLSVVSLGRVLGRVNSGDVINRATLPDLTFQAGAKPRVRAVRFEIRARGGRKWVWTARRRPFRMFAERKQIPFWGNVVVGEWVTIIVSTTRNTERYVVKFVWR